MAANPNWNDSQRTGSVINSGFRWIHMCVCVYVCVPPVRRQHAHTDVYVGGLIDGEQWWSELRWCGSADSQLHSSEWCWGPPALPPPLGSSGLHRQEVSDSEIIYRVPTSPPQMHADWSLFCWLWGTPTILWFCSKAYLMTLLDHLQTWLQNYTLSSYQGMTKMFCLHIYGKLLCRSSFHS